MKNQIYEIAMTDFEDEKSSSAPLKNWQVNGISNVAILCMKIKWIIDFPMGQLSRFLSIAQTLHADNKTKTTAISLMTFVFCGMSSYLTVTATLFSLLPFHLLLIFARLFVTFHSVLLSILFDFRFTNQINSMKISMLSSIWYGIKATNKVRG